MNADMNVLFPYNGDNFLTSCGLSACQEGLCVLEETCVLCFFLLLLSWILSYEVNKHNLNCILFTLFPKPPDIFPSIRDTFCPSGRLSELLSSSSSASSSSFHPFYQTGKSCGNLNSALLSIREHRLLIPILIPAVLAVFSSFLSLAVDINIDVYFRLIHDRYLHTLHD